MGSEARRFDRQRWDRRILFIALGVRDHTLELVPVQFRLGDNLQGIRIVPFGGSVKVRPARRAVFAGTPGVGQPDAVCLHTEGRFRVFGGSDTVRMLSNGNRCGPLGIQVYGVAGLRLLTEGLRLGVINVSIAGRQLAVGQGDPRNGAVCVLRTPLAGLLLLRLPAHKCAAGGIEAQVRKGPQFCRDAVGYLGGFRACGGLVLLVVFYGKARAGLFKPALKGKVLAGDVEGHDGVRDALGLFGSLAHREPADKVVAFGGRGGHSDRGALAVFAAAGHRAARGGGQGQVADPAAGEVGTAPVKIRFVCHGKGIFGRQAQRRGPDDIPIVVICDLVCVIPADKHLVFVVVGIGGHGDLVPHIIHAVAGRRAVVGIGVDHPAFVQLGGAADKRNIHRQFIPIGIHLIPGGRPQPI